VVIAGHNGAGKTTFYKERLEAAIGARSLEKANGKKLDELVATEILKEICDDKQTND
jgi:predicted ABC-type ATPase